MKTVNHECYVSLEVAKLLKEAGFNWNTLTYYPIDHELLNEGALVGSEVEFNHNRNDSAYSAPNLEVAQRWLREVKYLEISIHYDPTIKIQPYMYNIYDMDEKFNDIDGIISPITHSYSDGYFYKCEEALEAGIKKALEIILEKGE